MKRSHEHFIISALALLWFVPGLGAVHLFDWDEINFAESAREMLLTGSWWNVTINFESFWEKPPLFIWLQALCMKLFGVGEFAARLPNALAGLATLNAIWWISAREGMRRTGVWWIALYLGCIAPHFYFRSGIIDPWFNLFIFLAYYRVYLLHKGHGSVRQSAIAGVFLGLAVLTKGPVAILIVCLSALVLLLIKRQILFNWKDVLTGMFCTLMIIGMWLGPLLYNHGFGFITSFMNYQLDLLLNPVASHGQPFYYHFIVLLFLCFPASILAFIGSGSGSETEFRKWMQVLFWTVLLLFSAVTTKIVHYSSMCYLPLTFLAAERIQLLFERKVRFSGLITLLLALIGTVLNLVFIVLPVIGANAPRIVQRYGNKIHDPFAMENLLAPSIWTGYEWMVSILFLIGLVCIILGLRTGNSSIVLSGLGLNALFIALFSIAVVPAVEAHTQGSIIRFYDQIKGKDVYVHTYRFKTYAHYFYTDMRPMDEKDGLYRIRQGYYKERGVRGPIELGDAERKELSALEFNYLLSDSVDRPVLFVCQTRKRKELDELNGLTLEFSGGGYYVFRH
ncbi:MAG: glycosyltransferase family 39 protein [Flavobacteriales bacterium]|nr:glycosyltransferase family 39 protein [Flavobacteriales bacterium]